MADRFRCTVASRVHAEALGGTASTVRRWFVVEQPGSWGHDAITESGLPPHVARALQADARRTRTRLLLVRRGRAVSPRRAYAAFSGPGEAWLESHDVDDPESLLAIDLDGLEAGGSTGGERVRDSIVLTCTNGRHDACCAEFGRPTAAALEALLGHRAWEVSHIGGDRFAPNVLVLPHGLYYGRATLASAPDLARAVTEDRIWLPGYRGRSIHPFSVQAAEGAVRRARQVDHIDAVQVVDWRRHQGSGVLEVEFSVEGERWQVDVDTNPHADAWRLTCQTARASAPPVHRIAGLARLARPHRDQ